MPLQGISGSYCRDRFIRCTIFLAIAARVGFAQQTTADIVGTATDQSGAVIVGAKVTVQNAATSLESNATTDPSGNYALSLLPPGHYTIRASAAGFKNWTATDLTLSVGDRVRQDVQFQIGSASESIEVTAALPALQTDSSTVGSLINERAMQDLPVNGRNFVSLAQLAAGANEGEANGLASGARPDDRRQTSGISVNSQPSSSNNFLLDGMDDNERFIGTVIVKPSIDAIQEMKVQTSSYSAELGRTSGGVINFITKSGGNAYHGSLFEFFRNQKMDARNFFAGSTKPSYKQNQFGGSLGGRIIRDKTFFFIDYEGFRQRQGQTYASSVPTQAMRSGNFAGVNAIFDPLSTITSSSGSATRTRFAGDQIPLNRIDPVGQRIMNLLPLPQTNGLINNYTLNPVRSQNNDTFDIRGDHHFSDTDSLFVRYSYNTTTTLTPGAFPVSANGINPVGDTGFSGTADQKAYSAQINYLKVITPQVILELKAGFNRFTVQSLPPNYGVNANDQVGIPGTNVDLNSSGLANITVAGYRAIGDAGFIPLITINNMFQESAAVSYLRGGHSFKFGADLRRRQLSPFQSAYPKGQFVFDANLTNDPSAAVASSGNALASLLLGYPASTQRSKYLVNPGLRLWETDAFVQDDWRVTRWLTLNLGLRYDYYGPLSEVSNRISNVDPYTGRFLIAGQNGVSNSAGVAADRTNFAPRFGFAASLSKRTVLRGGFGINYVPPFLGSILVLRNPPFVSLYNANATTLSPLNRISDPLPSVAATSTSNPTGNLSPVSLDGTTPYVEQYNVTLQQELPYDLVATASYVGALGHHQYIFNGSVNLNQPAPGPGAIQPRRPFVGVFPLVASINMAAPWYNSNYHALQSTLERRYKNGFSLLATYTYAHSIDDNVQQVNNRRAERGNSFLDQRHRFTLLGNYDLPFGKGANGVSGFLMRGWSVNAVLVLATGLPFNITSASPRSNTGVADRPNVVCDPTANFTPTVSSWFNSSCFASQSLYTFGSLARNYLHSPGRKQLDFAIHREFNIREAARLQFRAEAFNITNTAQFGTPAASFGASTFGVISSALQARNIQLALKFLF